jgi:ATP citrate (pro-S)-lyase
MIGLSEEIEVTAICLGNHPGIIQSMLDHSYCLGKDRPDILALVAGGRKQVRFFWGEQEIIIPVYADLAAVPDELKQRATVLLNVQSARRVLAGAKEALTALPNLKIATIFAEQVPEAHSLQLAASAKAADVLLIGPASVGLLIPGHLKLGAIGGTQYAQLAAAGIFKSGDHAVISTSGGMVNELIHTVTGGGNKVSFAIALGGDRYPITTPAEAFLLAENDPRTTKIVYFGELGGTDEYEIAELIKNQRVTKPVIAYIAGSVAELFAEPPQFGHAKAMAGTERETAKAKKEALRQVGVEVIDVFGDLSNKLKSDNKGAAMDADEHRAIGPRKPHLIVSTVSGEIDGDVQLLGQDLLKAIDGNSLAGLIISLLLGQQIKSEKLVACTDYVLRLSVDNGPYVAGAINTIVAARAGRDLVSSLSAGLLTIGPRFGGAINAAAGNWLSGVQSNKSGKEFVVDHGGIIPGIGHKKYRLDLPDPRVESLIKQFRGNSNQDRYLKFAKDVEAVTTGKKGNLILNVDGTIAAILLDLLESELNYSPEQLKELVDIEFFNALFILSRSIGFTAHYLDQKRHDEGLLRLGPDDIAYIPKP